MSGESWPLSTFLNPIRVNDIFKDSHKNFNLIKKELSTEIVRGYSPPKKHIFGFFQNLLLALLMWAMAYFNFN